MTFRNTHQLYMSASFLVSSIKMGVAKFHHGHFIGRKADLVVLNWASKRSKDEDVLICLFLSLSVQPPHCPSLFLLIFKNSFYMKRTDPLTYMPQLFFQVHSLSFDFTYGIFAKQNLLIFIWNVKNSSFPLQLPCSGTCSGGKKKPSVSTPGYI